MNRPATDPAEPMATSEIGTRLRKLEKSDWWHWWSAIAVILALTAGVAAVSILVLLRENEPFFQFNLNQALHGLVGMVLLFNIYAIYQQLRIKNLRNELAGQMALAIKQEIRAEELYKLAMLDPLTGLHNRRFGEERLMAEMTRSRRHEYPLTVLILDLDKLKEINDCLGHAAGDFVLKEFARRLSKATRGSDLTVRLGGDEFLVLLPECHLGHVDHVLTRLRGLEVDWQGKKITATFSAGWTNYQPDESPEELIQRADHALYANKRSAENRAHQPTMAR